ncbi:hypothetical protein [Pseudogemmobacter bohemicus]|uniref:hypothetical protein n=1 Tax=Pseudogemmobacter bohemicus TaxID=2250708 RepID=UPI000DD4A779|nr:hypothetical protein [Pseudogemmobacter bohemicus]
MKKTGFDRLACEVCAKYGFCGSGHTGTFVHVTDFLPESGPVTAEQFTDWLLIADGYDPESQAEVFEKFRAIFRPIFIKHMGADCVEAGLLYYSPGNSDGFFHPRRRARRRSRPGT